ncbi:MAG: hypothetical protein Q4G09_00130 [Clostridia bacterium]|nr:hypothetical protein [Clostridia bacterium]
MIDPWKFNPLTALGNKAGNLSEAEYLKTVLEIAPKTVEETKKIRRDLKNGTKTIIENSNELFL